jgi:hypothetical protein
VVLVLDEAGVLGAEETAHKKKEECKEESVAISDTEASVAE